MLLDIVADPLTNMKGTTPSQNSNYEQQDIVYSTSIHIYKVYTLHFIQTTQLSQASWKENQSHHK